MRRPVWQKRSIIFATIFLVLGVVSIFLIRKQMAFDINSTFMKEAHQVGEKARPIGYRNPYSFDLDDGEFTQIESQKCKDCHGTMLDKVQGKPKYPIHYSMLKTKVLKFQCIDCHKKVDLGPRTPKKATFRVDRVHCLRCHEQRQKQRLGTKENDKALELIGDRNLISNHGIDQKDGMKWIGKHFKVAAIIGVEHCRRCHAFGSELDFCNDCHKGLHGANWKGRHFKVAKERGVARCRWCHTRGSYMDFCQERCHGAKAP